MSEILVAAHAVSQRFGGGFLRGKPIQAVSDVTLSIRRGEILGLVGESGSGKSTVGRLLLGMQRPSSGQILFDGADLARLGRGAWRRARRRMQLVFQDPYSSLDPRRKVGAQIADGLNIHGIGPPAERPARVDRLMRDVGVAPALSARFPREFSGGQRQRLAIARALAPQPDFIVADEPVSALDVSIQSQVLALLGDLRAKSGLAMLFISHDLLAVRHLCDRVAVMYLGRIVEEGPVRAIFTRPRHPYTAALLSASPSFERGPARQRILLRGEPPSPADPPSGCVFRTRCLHALPACAVAVPPPLPRPDGTGTYACIRHELDAPAA